MSNARICTDTKRKPEVQIATPVCHWFAMTLDSLPHRNAVGRISATAHWSYCATESEKS